MTKYQKPNKKIPKKAEITKSKTIVEVEDPELAEWKEMVFRECEMCPFGCLIVSNESKIEKTNLHAANIFKFDISELIGNDINILIPPGIRKDH